VYSDGRISSVKRGIERFLLLQTTRTSAGYLSVNLHCKGKPKTHQVHRLVAEAFVRFTPCKEMGITVKDYKKCPASVKRALMILSQINHIDHNKQNANSENLEFTTPIGNALAAQVFYNKK
jgi:hypothetical protein